MALTAYDREGGIAAGAQNPILPAPKSLQTFRTP
jgi:hypothetical protein